MDSVFSLVVLAWRLSAKAVAQAATAVATAATAIATAVATGGRDDLIRKPSVAEKTGKHQNQNPNTRANKICIQPKFH